LKSSGYRGGEKTLCGSASLASSRNEARRRKARAPNEGNVELGIAFCVEGSLPLRDVVPELAFAPASAIELREHDFPELGRNLALAIDEAVHDPLERTLVVRWSEKAADLPPWRLTYDGSEVARSEEPPPAPVLMEDFVLRPSSAEVVLHVDGREYPVPILVTDLVALPAMAQGPGLGLTELLQLLGRRMGAERALQIAEKRGSGDEDELEAFFGESLGPTDVFRAWWATAP
jgi:hypothetical protein